MEIRVGRGLRFGARTLPEALGRPTVSDILLSSGVHEVGTIRISRSVRIRGEQGTIVVGTIMVESGSTSVADLALQGSVLALAGTSVEVRNASIRAVDLAAVFVAARATVRLVDTLVVGAPDANTAVRVSEDGVLDAEGCTLEGAKGNALQVIDNSSATLRRTRVWVPSAVAAAVWAVGQARLIMEEAELTATYGNALYAGESAAVEARDSTFHSAGEAAAIWVYGQAQLHAAGGRIGAGPAPAVNAVEETQVRLDHVAVSTESREDAAVALWGSTRLTLTGGDIASPVTHALLVAQRSEAVLDGASLTGGLEQVPVVALGNDGRLTARRSRVTTGTAIAVLARDQSQVDLQSCTMERPQQVADPDFEGFLVMAEDDASLAVAGGTVTAAAGSGLYVTGRARTTLRDLGIRCPDLNPHGYGIALNGTAALTASGITVEGFRHNLAAKGGTADLSQSLLGQTPQGRASVWVGAGHITFAHCVVRNSGHYGVAVTGRARCELRETTVEHSAAGGIDLAALADATLTDCVLEDNHGYAVRAASESRGTVARCIVRGHHQDPPLLVEPGSHVTLEENVIMPA